MSKLELLSANKSYYKANLHAHTTVSDGSLTPAQLKASYKAQGYSIVAFTDHNRYVNHSELCDEDFVALAALEIDIVEPHDEPTGWSAAKCYHINFYDTDPQQKLEAKQSIKLPEQRYSDIDYINRYIDAMAELGFIACYNHPYWSCQSYMDYKDIRGCFAMEIYNHGCEVEGLYGYNPQAYDEMLRSGNRLFCLATDDNHNRFPEGTRGFDSFGGFVQLQAEELSYPAVIDALRTGRFYASRGPSIHSLVLEGNRLTVECSDVASIYVATGGRDGHMLHAPIAGSIRGAAFTLSGNEGYVRVICRDEMGLDATTNAYFMP